MDEQISINSFVTGNDQGYTYNVKRPSYLSFTGNLAVATVDDEVA